MANITILEALQLSLNATKKYVDDNDIKMLKYVYNGEILKITLTDEQFGNFQNLEIGEYIVLDSILPEDIYKCTDTGSIWYGCILINNILFKVDSFGSLKINTIKSDNAIKIYTENTYYNSSTQAGIFRYNWSLAVLNNTEQVVLVKCNDIIYHYASTEYVDDKVAEVNASGGYTHPDSHPASMITGLATVATSGSYNDLTNKPTIPIKTSELTNDSGFTTKKYVDEHDDHLINIINGGLPLKLNVTQEELESIINLTDNTYTILSSISPDLIESAVRGDDWYSTLIFNNSLTYPIENTGGLLSSITCIESSDSINIQYKHNFYKTHTDNLLPFTDVDDYALCVITSPDGVKSVAFAKGVPKRYDMATKKYVDDNKFSGNYNDLTNKPIIPSEYNLPIASQTTLGGIKVGAGLSITAEGVLSATGGGTADSVNWENVVGKPTFATVATSGDYNDLTNRPIKVLPNDTTAADLYNLEMGIYLLTNNIEFNITDDTNMENGVVFNKFSPFTLIIYRGNGMVGDLSSNIYYVFTSDGSLISAGTTDNSWAGTIATVATTGSYNDLTDKPTIPTIPNSLPANGGNADTVNNFRLWKGTQAQYDAITTKDSNTIYMITE